MSDNPAEVGDADAYTAELTAAVNSQQRSACRELAALCSRLAERVGGAAASPRLREPAAEMLLYAVRALQLAADLIGLVPPYEQRCELGWSVFGSGGDWTISPPLDTGQLRMSDAVRAGCVVHLASAVVLGLGTLEADVGVRDSVADRIAQHTAADDARTLCELGQQTRLTTDLYYRCHGDRRFGRYVFAASGRRPFGCIVHLVEVCLGGVVGAVQATQEARAAIDHAVARRRAGGLPPGPQSAATLSRFRELSRPLRCIPPYPHPGPDDTAPGTPSMAEELTR